MKKLLIIAFLFISFISKGQVYQNMPQYGYSAPRFNTDSTISIPTTCGVPTLKSNLIKKAAIAFDSCNNRFYFYNPKTLAWDTIKSGGGSSIDTTNKFVSSVTKLNDSTIRVIKGISTTDITLTPSVTVTSATRLATTVYNNSGVTITKGSVVYINGRHSSNYPTIALAQANTELNSYSTFAMVADDILNNNTGTVVQAGNIGNLNLPTSSYTDGDLVYLSPTVAGGITTTKPLAPYHIVKIGTITRAHPTFGSIELKIENGWQLDELSDVQIAAVPADSTILQFSRVDSLWHDVNPTTAMGNRFVKISDSAVMLSKYLRKSDTSSLSNRINLKLNISDTASMLNTYLRKIDTSTLSNRINLKVNYTDTSSMLTPYLRKADTTSMLTPYLRKYDTTAMLSKYLRASDTTSMLSKYTRSYLNSYTFLANNTTSNGNGTAQTFRDSTQKAYTGTITWTGTTAPSGSTNHSYQWSQIGKIVFLRINLDYATVGSALTQVIMTLPSDCPAPVVPTNVGATHIIVYASGALSGGKTLSTPTTISPGFAGLRVNAAGTGYELIVNRNSSAYQYAYITVQYFAQ